MMLPGFLENDIMIVAICLFAMLELFRPFAEIDTSRLISS